MSELVEQHNQILNVIDLDYVTTRYQGSKRRISSWMLEQIREFQYQTVLDALSGTASVAYEFKKRGKEVVCNDILKSNYYTALALIENSQEILDEKDILFVLSRHQEFDYPTFIQDTFKGIYYTAEENAWLDLVVTNIRKLENPYKKALAFFALFQSCTSDLLKSIEHFIIIKIGKDRSPNILGNLSKRQTLGYSQMSYKIGH